MTDFTSSLPTLTILAGGMGGHEFVLDEVVDNILVGSDPSCKFHLPLPGISPIHARIWVDMEGVTVYDTNSPRGLYINDDRVIGKAALRNGDVLWLGAPGDEDAVMMQFRVPGQAGEEAPGPAAPAPPESTETVFLGAPLAPATTPVTEAVSVTETAPVTEAAFVTEAPPVTEAFEVVEEPAQTLEEIPAEEVSVEEVPAEEVPEVEMVAEEAPSEFEVVSEPPSEFEETQILTPEETPTPTLVVPSEEEPTRFEVELPSAPLPPVPALFEDETVADAPAPAASVPPPPAPAPPPRAKEPVVAPPVVARPAPAVAPPRPAPPSPPRAAPRPAPAPAAPSTARPAAPVPAPKPAPKPAKPAAKPAAPPPAPAEREVAPPVRPQAASPVGRYAVFGIVGLLVVGGAIFGALRLLKPAAPTTAATAAMTPPPATLPRSTPPSSMAQPRPEAPTPEPTPVPEPPVEEAVTLVKPAPPPTPKPADTGAPGARTPAPPATTLAAQKPTPAPPQAKQPEVPSPEALKAQQVADLLGKAEAALAARSFESASGLFDNVLKLDPQNARASAGKTTALAGAAAARKAFVVGHTTIQSGRAAKGSVSGFDSADVSVAKAPDYSGRIEFEVSVGQVKPGDSYLIKVYLFNDGKKPFKIGGLTLKTIANGAPTGGPVAPPAKEVAPQQRVLLQEVSGTWQEGVNSWALEVVVTSNHDDVFKNRLVWK